MKVPTAKTPQRTALRFQARFDERKTGSGMRMMMTSDEMLKTALVMRWFVAAEHWAVVSMALAFLIPSHTRRTEYLGGGGNVLSLGGTAQ